jgi:hypothetical protein
LGKFPGLHSAELRYQLRYNLVKLEPRYVDLGVRIPNHSEVSEYASVLLKEITEFEKILSFKNITGPSSFFVELR